MMYARYTATLPLAVRNDLQTPETNNFFLGRLLRRAIAAIFAGVGIVILLCPVHAEELSLPAEIPALQAVEPPAAIDPPVPVDPFIKLQGSVWRTKAGIVFLKTPVGLLTLTSKTALKDLKASQEVRFWLHDRHSIVEIRKRSDGSLVHRYLSGPMTSGTDVPRTLRWWGPDGDQTIHLGTQEERLTDYREGDLLTIEVDETNTMSGVHDLQFDLQVSQAPEANADVSLLLSGTVSKLKSNFIFVRTSIGLVMLNSKIGVPQVKVGQPLTLQINHEQVTVTVPPTATVKPYPRRGAALIQ